MSTTLLEIATDVCFWWLWWIPRAAHVLLWGAVILFAFNSDDNVGGRLQWIFRNNRVKASILLCAALAIEWWVQPSVAVLIIRLLLKLLSVQGIAAAVTMVFVTGMTHSSTRNPFVSLGLGGAVSACMFQAIRCVHRSLCPCHCLCRCVFFCCRLLRFDWHPALLYILVVVQRIAMLGGFGGAAGVGIVANICNLYHRRRLELVPVFWACALGVTAFGFECLYSYLYVQAV